MGYVGVENVKQVVELRTIFIGFKMLRSIRGDQA
jgi:hypothetical protein